MFLTYATYASLLHEDELAGDDEGSSVRIHILYLSLLLAQCGTTFHISLRDHDIYESIVEHCRSRDRNTLSAARLALDVASNDDLPLLLVICGIVLLSLVLCAIVFFCLPTSFQAWITTKGVTIFVVFSTVCNCVNIPMSHYRTSKALLAVEHRYSVWSVGQVGALLMWLALVPAGDWTVCKFCRSNTRYFRIMLMSSSVHPRTTSAW